MPAGLLQVRAVDPDPWRTLDGRLGAATTGFINPTLLNGYPIAAPPGARVRSMGGSYEITDPGRCQPPWMVAGVDYPVGCPITSFAPQKTAVIGGAFTGDFLAACAFIDPTYENIYPRIGFGSGAIRPIAFDGWDLRGMMFFIANGGGPGQCTQPFQFTNCEMGGGIPAEFSWHSAFGPNYQASPVLSQSIAVVGNNVVRNCSIDGSMRYRLNVSCLAFMVTAPINNNSSFTSEYNYYRGMNGNIFNCFSEGIATHRYNYIDTTYVGYGVQGTITSIANVGGKAQITLAAPLDGPMFAGDRVFLRWVVDWLSGPNLASLPPTLYLPTQRC